MLISAFCVFRTANRHTVAAIFDRVTVQRHILETGTQSYRLRTSKNIRGKSN